jgi:hypothetical protein
MEQKRCTNQRARVTGNFGVASKVRGNPHGLSHPYDADDAHPLRVPVRRKVSTASLKSSHKLLMIEWLLVLEHEVDNSP